MSTALSNKCERAYQVDAKNAAGAYDAAMLEEVFNGTYKGKTQFCHKGERTIAAWNDYHSTEYCMVDDYHPIDAYNVAKQALQDRE